MGMVLLCAAASQTVYGKVAGRNLSEDLWMLRQRFSSRPRSRDRPCWLTGPATSPGSELALKLAWAMDEALP